MKVQTQPATESLSMYATAKKPGMSDEQHAGFERAVREAHPLHPAETFEAMSDSVLYNSHRQLQNHRDECLRVGAYESAALFERTLVEADKEINERLMARVSARQLSIPEIPAEALVPMTTLEAYEFGASMRGEG